MSAGAIIDEEGNFICISCKKKKPHRELLDCVMCEKFVCKACAVYHKQFLHGYHCKSCHEKSIKK